MPFETCYDIVINTINYVLEKRVWENPDSSLYKDDKAPDKAFHIVLKRFRSITLSNLNAQKRKSNFNTLSIDELYEDYNDAAEGLFDIADDSSENFQSESWMVEMINKYPTLEKMILDKVCFSSWTTKLQIIYNVKKLGSDDFEYFNKFYHITRDEFFKCLLEIKNSSVRSLMSLLNKTLYYIKKEYTNHG